LLVRVNDAGSIGTETFGGLVIEAPGCLVHQDHILPIGYDETGSAGLLEIGASRQPLQRAIAVAAADPPGLGDIDSEFRNLVIGSPQRCANSHGRHFAAGVLEGMRLACYAAIFFCQTRIENPAEIYVS